MKHHHHEAGAILVLVLLVGMVMLAVGLTAMWLATSGRKVSGNVTRHQEALYVAESGLERARAILSTANWDDVVSGNFTCDTPATQDALNTKGKVLCANGTSGERLQDAPLVPSTTQTYTQAPTLGRMTYTVWIRNDWESECGSSPGPPPTAANCGGNNPRVDRNNRAMIRVEGIGSDGLSYAAVESLMTRGGSTPTGLPDYSQAGMNAQGNNAGQAFIGH